MSYFRARWGGLKGVEAQLPRLAELGFDVVLPTADPSDRRDEPQGDGNNSLVAGPGGPRLTVGDRGPHGWPRTPSTPSSGTGGTICAALTQARA